MSAQIEYFIVIPARFSSERLPGKMLLDLGGKPLLQHTWERAVQSSAAQVVIATDDERIEAAAHSFGAQVVMTSYDHRSGSDRIAECARLMSWEKDCIIVNLQGDEPLMPASCLDQVAILLSSHPKAMVSTLYREIEDPLEVNDPNAVKVVCGVAAEALMFSRSTVPYARDFDTTDAALQAGIQWRRHIGLYAYRRGALDWFARTPVTPLESAEKLEQLRFLEHGHSIVLARAAEPIPPGVDTANDLARVATILEGMADSIPV